MRVLHHVLTLDTDAGLAVYNLTLRLRALLAQTGVREGFMIASSRHTTTAITINEDEPHLPEDVRRVLDRLVPKDAQYLHNDIAARGASADEPPNAHAHLAALLLGASETIPVLDGALALGIWQSVLFVELDGLQADAERTDPRAALRSRHAGCCSSLACSLRPPGNHRGWAGASCARRSTPASQVAKPAAAPFQRVRPPTKGSKTTARKCVVSPLAASGRCGAVAAFVVLG